MILPTHYDWRLVALSVLSATGAARFALGRFSTSGRSKTRARLSAKRSRLEPTGNLPAGLACNRDVSAEDGYLVLFERSLAGIYHATREGIIVGMNEACSTLLGYASPDLALGQQIADRFEDGHFGPYATPSSPREVRLITLSGAQVWAMHSATLLLGCGEALAEIHGILLSIDEIKRAEDALRAAKWAAESANLAKSRFLANLSHELRTPLINGILEMVQLSIDMSESDEQRALLQHVKNSAQSLASVIDNILEFSKLETAKIMLASEAFNLRSVAESVASAFLKTGYRKKLIFEVEVAPHVAPRFMGDFRCLREILAGLFENAVKFTESGKVTIQIQAAGASGAVQVISIAVHDTGVGIPANKLATIFEPFHQSADTSNRRLADAGLRLAIIRNLAEAMGGRIAVESRVGEGSTFTLLIPLHVALDMNSRFAA